MIEYRYKEYKKTTTLYVILANEHPYSVILVLLLPGEAES